MADYDIGEAFNRIQDELISSMIRNMSHHRKLEKAEGIEYAQWQAEQLQALNEYIQNNQSRFKKPYKLMDKEINKAIRAAYKEGRMNEEIKILKAIKKGYNIKRPNKAMQAEFFTINERSLNAMLDEINTSVHNVQTAILRRADDEYRKALFNSQVYFESGAASLTQAVDMATKDMLARGLSCVQYRNGRMVGAAEYAEMALRTSITRAYLKGQAAMRDEWGINTVLVNKRIRACPKCIKWVNKVYYDDVWGNSKIPDDKYPRLSEAIAGGLYHPNCKDIHTTYFEGITNIPPPLTEEEIRESEAEYKREQHEKYIQRNIDKYKRMEKGSLEPENKERYKQLKKKWQSEKKTFGTVDNSAESGIINLEIDEFVPCLQDKRTGQILETEVARLYQKDLKKYNVNNNWNDDWSKRPNDEEIFGLFIKGKDELQGLISLRYERGGTYIASASTAPHNNKQLVGENQKYIGVGGHLFALAVEQSLKNGGYGTIYGYATNEKVLEHYMKKFGAYNIPVRHEYQFVIDGENAQKLIDIYNYERR